MGGCFSVSLSCDQVVNQVSQCFCVAESYIHNLEENLAALEITLEDLKARRDDLSRRVEREENKGLRRLSQVQVWLNKVENIENQVNRLFSVRKTELQRLCLCGFCSKSLTLSYRYGKLVSMSLREVESLKSNGVFEVVAELAQTSEMVERPIPPAITGRETMLETVWNRLMEDGVSIMGLYGMGGVGKTTLLTQINNKFFEKGDAFDVMIWVVVSKDIQIQKIQEEVATKLGLADEDWNLKKEDQKVCEIHSILRRKKFLLLLDDIWVKVNLTEIGVPYPNKKNGCKVVFTTRSQEVCGRMGVDVEMEVKCLPPQEALNLFKKKVGEITLRSDPNIPELAAVVAKKCHGLPLALNVIGEAMSCKRMIQEWQHAIDVLTSYAAEFSGMEDEILPLLKYSYDNLKGEHVKSCLLYCALFPEDHRISKRGLIEYWTCEGIIDGSESIKRAENKGYEIIGSLIRASLLMEDEKKALREVYMHDVVREMALWIASDFGKHKENFIVRAGVGLQELPKVKNWNAVKRMSLMSNKIGRVSGSIECLELRTLFLQKNKKTLVNISGEFFKSMPRLVVMDLSFNEKLSELPDEISELVSLKYLNMSFTGIQCLPVGFRQLKNLTHLDLEGTSKLSSILGISALLSLKVLRLVRSNVWCSPNTLEELQVLEHLEILTIGIIYGSGFDHYFRSHKLMRCTQALAIKSCQLESSDVLLLLGSMENVHELLFDRCFICEIKMDMSSIRSMTVSPLFNSKNACFMNLYRITLYHCECVRELTWLMFASNLTVLFVFGVKEIEDIICREKASVGEESEINFPFKKLKTLRLVDLPELKNIYWGPLPFPCLTKIIVFNCPKLRKLPLNSQSCSGGEERLVIKYKNKEWLERIEWEDEATKARFLPSCIQQL